MFSTTARKGLAIGAVGCLAVVANLVVRRGLRSSRAVREPSAVSGSPTAPVGNVTPREVPPEVPPAATSPHNVPEMVVPVFARHGSRGVLHPPLPAEAALLPRVLEWCGGPSFPKGLSPLDRGLLRHVLGRLEGSTAVDVAHYRRALGAHIDSGAGAGAEDDEDDPLPLRTTFMVSETESGVLVHSTVIFSCEEEDTYSEECAVAEPFELPEHDAVDDDEEGTTTARKRDGPCRALVVGYGAYLQNAIDPRTIEAEAVHVGHALRRRGCDVTLLLGAEATGKAIRAAIASVRPSTVYVVSPLHGDHVIAPPQHCIVANDLSEIYFDEVQRVLGPANTLTIVVDTQSAVEVYASDGGASGPAIARVSLTTGAYLIAGSSAWLYDGHFTPRVLDLLSRSDLGQPLCAANVIAHVVHSIVPLTKPTMATKKTFAAWPHEPFVTLPFPT